jgi:uncharacterized membrane protein
MDDGTSTLTAQSTATSEDPAAPTTSTPERTTAHPDDPSTSAPQPTALTLGEVAGLAGVVAVGAIAVVSLALAQHGRHDGAWAVGLGLGLTAALLGVAAVIGGRISVTVDKVEIGLLVATVAAAAFFFLPGFPYAYADKDPGIYVAHGFAIARVGDVAIEDVAAERGLVTPSFPGVWPSDRRPETDDVTSQFYHLPSALFATADDLAGSRALFNVTPFMAIVAVALFVLAARRAANTWVAGIAGALLVTSMMQVWQAKYPSSEIPAEMFLAGALLAAVLAIERRWAGGAFVVGLLLGVGFLTRPDGFLYVLIAVALMALGIAIGQFDRRSVALIAGLALSLPYAGWNAYEARADYSNSNSVPGPLRLTLVCVALIGLGGLVRAVSVWWPRRRAGHDRAAAQDDTGHDRAGQPVDLVAPVRRFRVPIGVAVTLASAAVLTLLWYRGRLFGAGTAISPFSGERVPSYDERNMWWLAQFTTRPGLLIMWLGIAVLFLSRSKAALYVLVLPGALLLPLYLYDARISMRLMWWVRRFIPAVLPAIALLSALALGWALLHRWRVLKVVGAAATVALVVTLAGQSRPLRHHREMGGSWDIAYDISSVAGDRQGVFLFTESTDIFDPMRNSPVAVWWIFDEVAAKLPDDYDIGTVDEFQEKFPGQPVYLVLQGRPLPPTLPDDRFVEVRELAQPITFWDESTTVRPDEPITWTRGLTIWQLTD